MYYKNWAIVVPMANEEPDFESFVQAVLFVINELNPGRFYLIVDNASRDRTRQLCEELSARDERFKTIWSPENRNVVDAYLKGLRVAYEAGHDIIIEMDAGLSHDPRAIPMFLRVLNEGNDCAFGSRFINGGSMADSPLYRKFLSYSGTLLANLFLGTKLHDMTSGYQGFHRDVVAQIIRYKFRSIGHFYQVELRYLLRHRKICEVPIHYTAPSPRVSPGSIQNSIAVLLTLFLKRISLNEVSLSGLNPGPTALDRRRYGLLPVGRDRRP
jgi:dolichol-phosphate mannosyltransferase